MRPQFKYSDLETILSGIKVTEGETGPDLTKNEWLTPERIPVKSVYTKDDLKEAEHLNFAAGIAPFLRGPY